MPIASKTLRIFVSSTFSDRISSGRRGGDLMTGNLRDIDAFIEIHPIESERESIVDFKTMETAIAKIELKPFAISKYPVTNQQYYRFMKDKETPITSQSLSFQASEAAKGFMV
jgi:formylglycine-generating enzyme required for sulfatase activity